ncbi:hypothetical protein CRENBAI_023399 [Crenichthys baileyi]|uniref:Secreted protein n=1 Tax=Crenichthys baileyi TaxID=28760 RepID=A0AAV9RHV3_9TELE
MNSAELGLFMIAFHAVFLPKWPMFIPVIFCPRSMLHSSHAWLGSWGSWCGVHPGQVAIAWHSFTHLRAINLTGMSLDCGKKPEYTVRTHACTGNSTSE